MKDWKITLISRFNFYEALNKIIDEYRFQFLFGTVGAGLDLEILKRGDRF